MARSRQKVRSIIKASNARSLGALDPRNRRNDQASATDSVASRHRRDRGGSTGQIASIPTNQTLTLELLRDKLNEIIKMSTEA